MERILVRKDAVSALYLRTEKWIMTSSWRAWISDVIEMYSILTLNYINFNFTHSNKSGLNSGWKSNPISICCVLMCQYIFSTYLMSKWLIGLSIQIISLYIWYFVLKKGPTSILNVSLCALGNSFVSITLYCLDLTTYFPP